MAFCYAELTPSGSPPALTNNRFGFNYFIVKALPVEYEYLFLKYNDINNKSISLVLLLLFL